MTSTRAVAIICLLALLAILALAGAANATTCHITTHQGRPWSHRAAAEDAVIRKPLIILCGLLIEKAFRGAKPDRTLRRAAEGLGRDLAEYVDRCKRGGV